jgi:hypothetical protein
MIPFKVLLYASATSVYALPVANVTTSASGPNGPALPFINPAGKVALLWTSIGLAVVTSFWQGVIVTIVTIAEDQGMWTFRFRIARYEHWWWTVVSAMLSTSFCLIVFSFLSGNSSDSLGVLTLSTATAIAIVRYAIPAWRNRSYIELRWLSWTGPSRTGIPSKFRGKGLDWKRIRNLPRQRGVTGPTPSDEWGWAIRPPNGILQDPTALLQGLSEEKFEFSTKGTLKPCVYDDGYDSGQVSLLWGEHEGFRRRVSRAINSMPGTLLKSVPSTFDGFSGTGLCLAMGILGRNKGLAPSQLVFDIYDRRKKEKGIVRSDPTHKVTSELEATSAWYPRPNKVMRSFYQKAMEDQYSGLGPEFVGVAVELALILLDCPANATWQWLDQNLEQQSMELNQCMSSQNESKARATPAQLQTLYRASYASMIISINYFGQDISDTGNAHRPDLTCFALLWLAEVGTAPDWWDNQWVQKRLVSEANSLKGNWKRAASWLLGLGDVPRILDLNMWPYWAADVDAIQSKLESL